MTKVLSTRAYYCTCTCTVLKYGGFCLSTSWGALRPPSIPARSKPNQACSTTLHVITRDAYMCPTREKQTKTPVVIRCAWKIAGRRWEKNVCQTLTLTSYCRRLNIWHCFWSYCSTCTCTRTCIIVYCIWGMLSVHVHVNHCMYITCRMWVVSIKLEEHLLW